jgi:hypothetical protein
MQDSSIASREDGGDYAAVRQPVSERYRRHAPFVIVEIPRCFSGGESVKRGIELIGLGRQLMEALDEIVRIHPES